MDPEKRERSGEITENCPKCEYPDLHPTPNSTIISCPGCGRMFLVVGEPEEWAVIGHLER